MTLRLCHFLNVNQHRHMVLPTNFFSLLISITKSRIIPTSDFYNFISFSIFISLESFQYFRNRLFCCLIFCRNRNPIPIVPNGQKHRNLKYTSGIYSFKKHPFRRRSIPYSSKSNFITIYAKVSELF